MLNNAPNKITISRISTTIQPPARIAATRAFVAVMTAFTAAATAFAVTFAACAAAIAACLAVRAVFCVVRATTLAPCPAALAVTSVVRTALRPVCSAVLIVLPVPFTAAFPEDFTETFTVLIVFSPRSTVLIVCFGSSRICAPFFPASFPAVVCPPAVRPVCAPARFFICSFGW